MIFLSQKKNTCIYLKTAPFAASLKCGIRFDNFGLCNTKRYVSHFSVIGIPCVKSKRRWLQSLICLRVCLSFNLSNLSLFEIDWPTRPVIVSFFFFLLLFSRYIPSFMAYNKTLFGGVYELRISKS